MTASLHRGAAFLLGFSFAFLPSFGPFLAVFFFLANQFSFKRFDLLWGVAAVCFASVMAYHDGLSGFGFGLMQVTGPWLVYRAFFSLRQGLFISANSAAVAGGLVAGLAMVVGLGWVRMAEFNVAYKTLTQAIIWDSSPAFYGHTVFVLGALISILVPQSRLRFFALGLSALGILVAGSREAAVAWVAVMVLSSFGRGVRSRRRRIAEIGVAAFILALTSGLGSYFGWGRFGFLLDVAPSSNSYNLVPGSEIANGDWWDKTGVLVSSSNVMIGGNELTAYYVTKKNADNWLRLQQVIPITSGETYTVSAWIKPEDTAQAGLQGWGQLLGTGQTFVLNSALVEGQWEAAVSGPGRLLASGIAEHSGDWTRAFATFHYEGEQEILYWYVGLAPDRRELMRTSASFAGFQLEASSAPQAYVAGSASRGLSLADARIPYWQAAWRGVGEKPWLGHGPESFTPYYEHEWPNNSKLRALPSHVHNFFLQLLFERGLIGLLAVLILLLALFWGALMTLDVRLLIVGASILFINLFDVTLLYGAILYPLAAVAGWRVGERTSPEAKTNTTPSKQLAIRFGLAAVDFVMAYGAFAGALLVMRPADLSLLANPFSATTYALLLWPVLAWREGLYPGYGLTAPKELRKQVAASAYAALIFAAGTIIFGEDLPVSIGTLGATFLLSLASLPLGRASLKRLLLRAGAWGRELVIFGAGRAGTAVARMLLRHPLEGLKPVAFFDDDRAKRELRPLGLPVLGSLAEAPEYARNKRINHAVIAIPTMPLLKLSDFVHKTSRLFRHVQVVPELSGLPANEVMASPLAGFLALEFRNGLYIKRNQAVKRVLDLLGSTFGMILVGPVLGLIALLIRLDSPGPAFHASNRIGQHGKVFQCLKFRTMYTDADERLSELMAKDAKIRNEYARYHKLEHDPRITHIGKLLRKFSLDELPQFINVLQGDMSLVGPRPYLTREMVDIGRHADTIFEAKPGLTGYWQVSGRNALTFDERLEMEAHYVRNWSLWWDIVLLTKTPMVVLERKGAH